MVNKIEILFFFLLNYCSYYITKYTRKLVAFSSVTLQVLKNS